VAPAERIAPLGLSIAEAAARETANRELAAEVYEYLRALDPSARHIWEPLIALYRAMGDVARLQSTISSTLPTLVDPAERNALRMAHATHLIENLSDGQAAIEVLRDILLDNPDHLEAAALLEKVLRDSGDQGALADFLWQRFDEAKQRRNPETVIDVANRLGTLLDSMGSADALTVYRAALEIAPDSRDLLRAVLDHLAPDADGHERAALMERRLAVESAGNVSVLAGDLAALRESLGDADGVQRALELGVKGNPDDAGLRGRLERWYRDHEQWRPLAEMMTAEADRLADPALAVARLREAADVYQETLGSPREAAALLR
jgi:hypothetical protein